MADETFVVVIPPLKAVDNGDGTFSVSVEDVNSDELLAAVDSLLDNLPIDSVSGARTSIEFAHHETHEGEHFTYSQVDADFDIADAVELLIVTPDTAKWAHMVFTIDAQLDTNVKLYETATHTVLAAQDVFNNNRNSAVANTTTVNTHNDDGADGDLIFESQFGIDTGGGANRIAGGGQSRAEQEWILKQNTKYLLVVTSGSDNNVLSIKLSWYEHTNSG